MQKQAPTLGRLAVMVAFALSCFGLALFLWLAFGGTVPFKSKGYRFIAPVQESTQLATESDVRIAGVSVGKVKEIDSNPSGRSMVTIELDHKYAPIHEGAQAILRSKTLLGESYIELTPGSPQAKAVPDGGRLPFRAVKPTIELDELFRTFDPETRRAFQTWMQQQAIAGKGRGVSLSDVFGILPGFVDDGTRLLEIANKQQDDVYKLVRNTGIAFGALTARRGQLQQLIVNSNRVFSTIARRDQQLADTFVALPTFERESRATLRRLDQFAADTNPLIDQLRPAVRQLSPTLQEFDRFAPQFDGFIRAFGPLVTASEQGMPPLRKFLAQFRPVLQRIDPTFRNLNPFLDFIGKYPGELQALIGNVAGATGMSVKNGARDSKSYRVIRAVAPLNPQSLAAFPRPLKMARLNPYALPGNFKDVAKGLPSYNAQQCATGIPTPGVSRPNTFLPPNFDQLLKTYVYGDTTPDKVPTPACRQQGKITYGGFTGQYPHVTEAPPLPAR